MYWLIVIYTLFFINYTYSANILAIIPTPSYSHQVAFTELWKELSLNGHQVTVITTNPRNDPNLSKLREIDMKRSYNIWSGKYSFSESAQEGFGFWKIWDFFLNLLSDICEDQLSQKELQELIHESHKFKFDVVMVEVFYPELLSFGKIYNCPTVLLGTIDSTVQMYQYLGNPAHPILNSDINVPYEQPLTFKEKVISTLFYWNSIYFEYFKFLPRKQEIVDKYFGNVTKVKVKNLINDVDLMLLNVSPLIKGARAFGPTTIYVGGGSHLKPLKPLPKDLKDFLDNATEGFIYFSLGGNVKSKHLTGQTMINILDTLREIPYKVLWKFEADDLPGKPNNIKIIKWAPQQDILRHPNIKLFICQGGILSMDEAIFTNVPMLVIPFYGDQLKNAQIVERRGIGKSISHKPLLEKETFKNAILEIITDTKYKTSIKRLSKQIQDQPMSGLKLSIWWTEYVIRNKDTKEMRNPSSDLPYYQYYLVDVIGFICALIIIAGTVFFFLIRKMCQVFKIISLT